MWSCCQFFEGCCKGAACGSSWLRAGQSQCRLSILEGEVSTDTGRSCGMWSQRGRGCPGEAWSPPVERASPSLLTASQESEKLLPQPRAQVVHEDVPPPAARGPSLPRAALPTGGPTGVVAMLHLPTRPDLSKQTWRTPACFCYYLGCGYLVYSYWYDNCFFLLFFFVFPLSQLWRNMKTSQLLPNTAESCLETN